MLRLHGGGGSDTEEDLDDPLRADQNACTDRPDEPTVVPGGNAQLLAAARAEAAASSPAALAEFVLGKGAGA